MNETASTDLADRDIERPDYVVCLGKTFLSESGEAKLRQQVAHCRKALQAIVLQEDNESAQLVARQALSDLDNS